MARVDPQRLRLALRISAQLVARDGEAYLPIFLRLETEVAALDAREQAMERARAISRGGSEAGGLIRNEGGNHEG